MTATNPNLFQAPFRTGIRIDAYQLDPPRKALRLPQVNLFITDDVGLGKTIEAGLEIALGSGIVAPSALLCPRRRRLRPVALALLAGADAGRAGPGGAVARLETDARLHDQWHTWASRALALCENLPMIGRLLGHSRVETTARYAHLARDSVHDAASRIAAGIGADLLDAKTSAPRDSSG